MLKFSCDCFRKINREDSDEPYHLCLSPESMNVITVNWQVFWLGFCLTPSR